jgi:radical SAM superfamily enzyme YgiQ (UPF0313 family)
MKVLFINPVTPPHIFKVQLSMGVAYLSAVLKAKKHKTDLLCPYRFDASMISAKINEFKPDFVMVSTVSDQFGLAKKIINYISLRFNLPIIMGGTHPTVYPEESIKVKGVTGICIGEGEEALVEFVEKYPKTNIKNFWFNKNGKVIKNPIRPLMQDLNKLPFPDRTIFDKYVDTSDEIEFMGSRGCPYQCSYCVNKVLQDMYKGKGRYVRFRSVDNLIKEIKEVLSKYKTAKILFHDDTFTLDKKWLREFASKYKAIKKPYIANGRVETLDEEIIKLLKESGCVELKIGVESGNDRIRKQILHRNMTNKQIIEAFRLCKKYGILATSFNMIGLPGETEKEIKDTIALNKKIKPFRMGVSIFKPYPGTELYNICIDNKWISKRSNISYFEDNSVLDLPTISHKKIEYYYKIFKLSVYHPILVQFVKVLIFLRVYDPLIKLLSAIKRQVAKALTREQKDKIMKILKI